MPSVIKDFSHVASSASMNGSKVLSLSPSAAAMSSPIRPTDLSPILMYPCFVRSALPASTQSNIAVNPRCTPCPARRQTRNSLPLPPKRSLFIFPIATKWSSSWLILSPGLADLQMRILTPFNASNTFPPAGKLGDGKGPVANEPLPNLPLLLGSGGKGGHAIEDARSNAFFPKRIGQLHKHLFLRAGLLLFHFRHNTDRPSKPALPGGGDEELPVNPLYVGQDNGPLWVATARQVVGKSRFAAMDVAEEFDQRAGGEANLPRAGVPNRPIE